MLALRRVELERELEEKRWQLTSVEARLQQIQQENEPDPYEIVVKALEPTPVASLRHVSPTVIQVTRRPLMPSCTSVCASWTSHG